MPIISIIVPVYMVESYLDRFLSSLDSQTFTNFEVVFVYDTSSDNSLNKLETYNYRNIDKNKNVKIVHNTEKRGVGFAKDFGLSFSDRTSKYVMFIDSDDYFSEFFLEKLFNKAEETGADITCCGYLRMDENANITISKEMVHNPENRVLISDPCFPLFMINISGWNKLYRREIAEKCRFGSAKHGEDLHFFLEAIANSKSVSFVNEPLYFYMIHQNSLINNLSYSKFENALEVFSEFISLDGNKKLFDLISAFVFLRIGVSTTLRVYQTEPSKRKTILKHSRLFLRKFNVLSGNKYLSLRFLLKAGKKGFVIWLIKNMIKLRVFGVAAKFYNKRASSSRYEMNW